MSASPPTLAASSADLRDPSRRRRVYLFAVTGMAIFAVGLIIGLRKPATKPAMVKIACHQAGMLATETADPTPFDQRIAEELKSTSRLEKASARARNDQDRASRDRSIDDVRKHLRVTMEGNPARESGTVAVSYHGQSAMGAEMVNRLAEQLVDDWYIQRKRREIGTLNVATQAARSTQRRQRDAGDRLKVFLERNPGVVKSAANPDPSDDAYTRQKPKPVEPNPQWQEARKHLTDIESRRFALLASRTAAHPVVQSLDLEITDIHARIRLIPSFRVVKVDPPHDPKPTKPAESPAERARRRELAETYVALKKSYAKATKSAEAARNHVRQRQHAVDGLAEKEMSVTAWATFEEPDRGGPLATVMMSLLLGLVGGLVMASKGVPNSPFFHSRQQLEAELEVPVLGEVSATPNAPAMENAPLPATTRAVKLGSECVLATVAVVFLVAACLDASVIPQMLSDPLSAIPQAVERLASIRG